MSKPKRSPRPAPARSGVDAFSFVHEGEELLVLSTPIASIAQLLTRAEMEIANAIASGASNAEIARRRGTSVRTVANQVASILRRLGATSRSQIALKLRSLGDS